jgi:glycosyltransferase involved in cell wall biosynthesis
MPQPFVFAKKLRLPSNSANTLQSLNMALAFSAAGLGLRWFPGCAPTLRQADAPAATLSERRKATLLTALRDIGVHAIPQGCRVLPATQKGLYSALFRLALLRERLRDSQTIFYARDISEAYFLSSLNRFLPLTLVFEIHEVLHLKHKTLGSPRWKHTFRQEKKIFANISGLVLINEYLLEQIQSIFNYRGPVLIAQSAFNSALFSALPLLDAQNPWPSGDEPVTLVYAGNLIHGKGLDELLEALTLLPERFRLRLIGGNPSDALSRLQALAEERGISHRVRFYGLLPQDRVAEACRGAHMFVIPQQSEFFFSPLKLFEAFALGLPVVVTPLPMFQQQIRDQQVFAAPDSSPQGLAEAIRQLAASPELAGCLRENALREAPQHTWERRARRIADFTAGLKT